MTELGRRQHPHVRRGLRALSLLVLLAGCSLAQAPLKPVISSTSPIVVDQRPYTQLVEPCADRFVAHPLPHTTQISGPPFDVLDGNGSGLALGDLDGDGWIDLVLGNLNGPNSILWNQGGMRFQRQTFGEGQLRGVAAVDVDGDGLLDIVGAHRYQKPIMWHNTGNPDPQQRFAQTSLPDVNNEAYAIDWGDLDGDGDLDLVAGSYDTELLNHQGLIFTQRGNGVGVFVYLRDGATYTATRLADQADALAIALPDLNRDGRPDILIGNDFNRRDYAFVQQGDGWQATAPFDRTTENTMSLDLGDVDNDGRPEIFATDMKPVAKDSATLASWLPMMKRLTRPLTADDPQYVENVLQTQSADGGWRNVGYDRMVDSSGWSWSGKFGDLDRDGFLDLYVVNGMIARVFDYLPGQELVEPNMAFRNDRHGGFAPAPEWGLARTESGRSMSMADLDQDGDLDIVINNLNAPALVLENRLCGGRSVQVDLRWGGTQNLAALGAQITLETSAGPMTRHVRASSGYLSGDAARVHFGIPDGATVGSLTIRWPDGKTSSLNDVPLDQVLVVTR